VCAGRPHGTARPRYRYGNRISDAHIVPTNLPCLVREIRHSAPGMPEPAPTSVLDFREIRKIAIIRRSGVARGIPANADAMLHALPVIAVISYGLSAHKTRRGELAAMFSTKARQYPGHADERGNAHEATGCSCRDCRRRVRGSSAQSPHWLCAWGASP